MMGVVDTTREELLNRGCKRVILLGDEATMTGPTFKAPLAKAGLLVLTPGPADRAWLAHVATEELTQGILRDETVDRFERLMADGAEHGVDAVVVASAELASLVDRADLGLPVVKALGVRS